MTAQILSNNDEFFRVIGVSTPSPEEVSDISENDQEPPIPTPIATPEAPKGFWSDFNLMLG